MKKFVFFMLFCIGVLAGKSAWSPRVQMATYQVIQRQSGFQVVRDFQGYKTTSFLDSNRQLTKWVGPHGTIFEVDLTVNKEKCHNGRCGLPAADKSLEAEARMAIKDWEDNARGQ